MTKTISYTLFALIVLTTLSALVSNFVDVKTGVFLILFLSAIKFVLVSFQFMELKKAHSFWRTIILIFLITFMVILLIVNSIK